MTGLRASWGTYRIWAPDDKAYRATALITVNECNAMSALGNAVPVSGDATSRWIGQRFTMWQCECGWSNTGEDLKCQRCFLHRAA
jgi:hypothetical protein